jgi:hypothetical protein
MVITKIPIFFWFELLSLVIGTILIKRLRGSILVYFIPVLLITVAAESVGLYYKLFLHKYNGQIYNLLLFVQLPFFIFLLRAYIQTKTTKDFALIILVAFLVYGVINFVFIQGKSRFNNHTLITGALIIVLLSCYYCFELLKYGTESKILNNPMFWISSGTLFYFTGTFFYFALYDYLRKYKLENKSEIFDLIILNLVIVLYSFISIGFLCTKLKKE